MADPSNQDAEAAAAAALEQVPDEEEEEQQQQAKTANNKNKRLCRFPGCERVIKSQGHCQRHGAKAKRCKIAGCEKQAQGTHNGMCKRHWKEVNQQQQGPEDVAVSGAGETGGPMAEEGDEDASALEPLESVYASILPQSISYRPSVKAVAVMALGGTMKKNQKKTGEETAKKGKKQGEETENEEEAPNVAVMPLVEYLAQHYESHPAGWHRSQERQVRGIPKLDSLTAQLDAWERQLALVEILLLSGGTPHADFAHLAHAWGREKGFHQVLANSVCERRGAVERKRRSDAGSSGDTSKKASGGAKKQKTTANENHNEGKKNEAPAAASV